MRIRPYSTPSLVVPPTFTSANSSCIAYNQGQGVDNGNGQPLLAQTIFAVVRIASNAPGAIGYVVTQAGTGATQGIRFGQNTSNSWIFGEDSTGSTANPQRASASTVGSWNTTSTYTVAGTWDGTLTTTTAAPGGMHLYTAQDGAPLALDDGPQVDGSGSVDSGGGELFVIGNRADLGSARGFNGSIALIARWSRTLTLTELNLAKSYGPLTIPNGLTFCLYGMRDYGPLRMVPTTVKSITAGGFMQYVPPVSPRMLVNSRFGVTAAASTFPGGRGQVFG